MRATNALQLTEHHRFVVHRRFGLGPLEHKMVAAVYQPLIGAFAASLYTTMCLRLNAETVGSSEPAALLGLFLACGLTPNEAGRRRLIEETSLLEAVGLLKSYRRTSGGEVVWYEFHLQPPLLPDAFFGVHHLWLLLQEKLGPASAESVRSSLMKDGWHNEEEAVLEKEKLEELSTPFHEVFRVSMTAVSAAEKETAAAAQRSLSGEEPAFGSDGFTCDQLKSRMSPHLSPNRRHVERFRERPETLAKLNLIAGMYGLTLKETVSLLDEDGMFSEDGQFAAERFEMRAGEAYLRANGQRREQPNGLQTASASADLPQEKEAAVQREADQPYWLEVPAQFQGAFEIRDYNRFLVNTPFTAVLRRFFEPSNVPGPVERTFVGMRVNYKLADEVINVLIHYIRANDLDWAPKFLDTIAGGVVGKRIATFEQAVVYFRKSEQVRKAGGSSVPGSSFSGQGQRRGRTSAKPVIPVARRSGSGEASEADVNRILQKARRLNE